MSVDGAHIGKCLYVSMSLYPSNVVARHRRARTPPRYLSGLYIACGCCYFEQRMRNTSADSDRLVAANLKDDVVLCEAKRKHRAHERRFAFKFRGGESSKKHGRVDERVSPYAPLTAEA